MLAVSCCDFAVIVGVGVDLVEIARIREAVERHGARFLERVYTSGERDYCESRGDPYSHYAARFAVKEAFLKVLGTGWSHGICWTDVEVAGNEEGAPVLLLHGQALRRANELGIRGVHVSISHGLDHAVAMVVGDK